MSSPRTPPLLDSTLETVAVDTPASRATSLTVGAVLTGRVPGFSCTNPGM